MSLTSLLPKPKHAVFVEQATPAFETEMNTPKVFAPPPYGQRQKFIPRHEQDFGDGGAFPEIHILQYPLGMGQKGKKKGKTVQMKVDEKGNIKYDMILRQGHKRDKHIYGSFTDLVEKNMTVDELARPTEDDIKKCTEETAAALSILVDKSIAAAQPTHVKKQNLDKYDFMLYTPNQQGEQFNSGAKQRVIRVQEMPVDPLEPPKFRHKKIPNGPPSPPVPIMHSPPRKITVEDQKNWKIPPCISNWKNIKGYTIPLDKRLTADGRGLQHLQVNNKFASLTESLLIAERTARKAIEQRATMTMKLMKKQKEQKEAEFREKARQARLRGQMREEETTERETESYGDAQVAEEAEAKNSGDGGDDSGSGSGSDSGEESERDVEDRYEREELRRDRRRDIRREMRMGKKKKEKSGKIRKERDDGNRDISEKIALGKSIGGKNTLFDAGLFNRAESAAAGFGSDDTYNVYDKPLFKGSSANQIYRPKASKEVLGDNIEDIVEAGEKRFSKKPHRGFKAGNDGSDADSDDGGRRAARTEPVQFEKEDADPFGLGELLDKGKEKSRGNALDAIGHQGTVLSRVRVVSGSRQLLSWSGTLYVHLCAYTRCMFCLYGIVRVPCLCVCSRLADRLGCMLNARTAAGL